MVKFRLVSWNIDSRGDGFDDRIARLHQQFEPDVVLLQEVARGGRERLNAAPGFAWAELGVLHSEPGRGPGARIGSAILGSERVTKLAAGQVPREWFVRAGHAAGLSEAEVDGIGWRHKTIYVDVEVDGTPVRLCSFHARPGTGGGRGKPYVGWVKQLFHRVCAEWLADHHGAMIVGVDANSPKIDHPDPELWEPFMAGESTLIGPRPRHHLTDALYRWLASHPDELEQRRAERPDGPLAISYIIPQSGQPRRYDHLLVTDDVGVDAIEYRSPGADGSDHGAIIADLTLPEGTPP